MEKKKKIYYKLTEECKEHKNVALLEGSKGKIKFCADCGRKIR